MNRFSIKDVENLTGIKAHTLRIWEQRYKICIPKRKESNHRFYDSDDLKNILKVSYLYRSGLKISKIARLDREHLNSVAQSYFKLDKTNEHFISRLVEASIDFNEAAFEETFLEALLQNGIEVTVADIIYPFQEKIGVLWLTDHVIPAQEHFTSNLINRKIILEINSLKIKPKPNCKQVLLCAPEKDHHEIPMLFLQYLLKKNGHEVIYFGVNTKLEDIKYYVEHKRVSHLHFNIVTNLTSREADEIVNNLSEEFHDKQIVFSGPFVKDLQIYRFNVKLLRNREEVMKYVQE